MNPIYITMRDSTGKELAKYACCVVPFAYFKRAVALATRLSQLGEQLMNIDNSAVSNQQEYDVMDDIILLIVDVFGNRFTKEDIETKVDSMDLIRILYQITGIPTIAGGDKKGKSSPNS